MNSDRKGTPFRLPQPALPWVALAVALILFLVIWGSYSWGWTWTGLGPFLGPRNARARSYQRGKTLWDLLQLLVVPAVLAIGGYFLNSRLKQRELAIAAEHRAIDQEIARESRRDAALESYLGKMSELLLIHSLRESESGSELRNVARAWTLTVLPRLDGDRKGRLLQFLSESRLIYGQSPVIDLQAADFSGASIAGLVLGDINLDRVSLQEADLSLTNLRGAHITVADMSKADLNNASLENADLSLTCFDGANLVGAKFSSAKLMHASFKNAKLARAYLLQVDLNGADFEGADLFEAKIGQGALRGACLDRTRLLRAYVTDETLKTARSLEGAVMPNGEIFSSWQDENGHDRTYAVIQQLLQESPEPWQQPVGKPLESSVQPKPNE